MPKQREVTYDDVRRIRRAIDDLRMARTELRGVGAKKAADYVARAIKSAEGAERHAALCYADRQRRHNADAIAEIEEMERLGGI